MTQQHDETFLALQDEITKLYHQGPKPQPSAQLDEAILAQAQAELSISQSAVLEPAAQNQDDTNVVRMKDWRQYRWQLSSAASVVLVAGLFMMMPMEQHVNLSEINSSKFESPALESLSLDMPVADNQANGISPMAALKSAPMSASNSPSLAQDRAATNNADAMVNGKDTSQTRSLQAGSLQTESSLQAEPANETAKMAEKIEQSGQQKIISTLKPSARSELSSVAREQYSKGTDIISLDTADKAMLRLTELVKLDKLIQAEGYMLTMEQRFPELNNPSHPLHDAYHKIKQQLTVK
ncbi:hypothetical protein [Shewanella sp. OMA3-2]|uniref:hypothetical protein n=1 Tax=Shewanella sp. OMA3-2 TaxID=2908650 RepID=UPI001F2A8D81|nr:hypothetical protein [Shewanella sp. OMA3-2]UJF21389.1 hypothetical protein L0B17_15015 [Shewanella sp. OMA3-2]